MNSPIVDVNISFSRWPTRRIREDDSTVLADKLVAQGVVEAWVGSFDALLHKDVAAVNERLANECRAERRIRLRPFGCVNPMLPDWQSDLHRCHHLHRMSGVRLHPNYHRYGLDHPDFAMLLSLATKQKLIVAIAIQMEDERMMHPMLRVRPVDIEPLFDVLAAEPTARLLLLNAGRIARSESGLKLFRTGKVYTDLCMLDGLGGLQESLKEIPFEQVLYGSHAPYHYWEASLLKFQESQLEGVPSKAILYENARRLIPAEIDR